MIPFNKSLHLANLDLVLVPGLRQQVHWLIEPLLNLNAMHICSILSDSLVLCNGIQKANILPVMALLHNRSVVQRSIQCSYGTFYQFVVFSW